MWKTLARIQALVILVLAMSTMVAASQNLTACTPAQEAEYTQIEQKVYNDLVAGDSIPQIEQDVANLLGNDFADGGGSIAVTIVEIVQAAIVVLIDTNVLPPGVLPYAKDVLAKEKLKFAAMKGSP